MAFSHKYNTDDVVIRGCIVSLLNYLNNKISFTNTWGDKTEQLIRVPFFYAMSGDERFLQDAFSNWNDCYPDFIEGNTDPIPRGSLSLNGVSVMGDELTSRFVRGSYVKEIDGQLQEYNSYINSIPFQLNFTAEIMADSMIDIFKIIESIITVLYKTAVFNVHYKGFRIPTQAGFPENFNIDKQFEFSYGEVERLKVNFDIECQSYMPIPDMAQEYFSGNRVGSFRASTTVSNEEEDISISPPDVPNISPNEKDYRFPQKTSDGNSKSNKESGEGVLNKGKYWTGEYYWE